MSKYALKLALPLAILGACGGDDGDTGAADSTSGNSGNETTPGTTVEPTTADTVEPTTAADTVEPTTAADSTASADSTGPAGDVARVRVMHLGVGAPAVDVFANGEGPVFTGLEFRNSTDYAEVPPADYTFDVTVSGDPVADAVLSPMLTLAANTSYTAVAIGDLAQQGATGLQAIALVDDAEGIDAANVRITVIHAAPAVGQVDIWNIGAEPATPLLENVDFAASATLPDIPAGPLEIGVDVDDDATPDVTFSVDTTPIAGGQVNVYANNDGEGNVALVAQLADGTILTIDPN